MPEPYEWAVLRVVPRVERQEFVNAGVLVYCQAADFLSAQIALSRHRIRAIDGDLDLDLVRRHLEAIVAICSGEGQPWPGDDRTTGERFRWLVAPRSTVVQTSPVHTGLTADPAAEVERLMRDIVSPRDEI